MKQQLHKYISLSLLCLLWLLCGSLTFRANPENEAPRRPNIIIIMADDMGYSDLGCMGSEINTPYLDALANNGLLMTQFYNASRCCPSRAALLTGLYPHQAGLGDMTENRGYPSYQGYLNEQCITIAEALKKGGYTTLMTGKWHVGEAPEHWPQQRGFDHFYGVPKGGGVYFYPPLIDRQIWFNNKQVIPDSTSFYSTDSFNAYAVQFIDEQKNSSRPFFLYLAHIAPHFPLQAKPEDIARYRGKYRTGFELIRKQRFEKQKKLGIVAASTPLSQEDVLVKKWEALSEAEKDTFDLKMAVYAAQIESMDRGIGKVLEKLKENGQLANTLIFFLSDNGAESEEPRKVKGATGPVGSATCWESYSPSWANVSNTPFRMYKHWVYEGGIATPLIIHYPPLTRGKQISRQIGHITDIMATCLELAQVQYPREYKGNKLLPLEGQSLVPVMQGNQRREPPSLCWEHEGNRAVRQGDWKLVSSYPDNTWELYHLSSDPTELQNVSSRYSSKVQEMEALYNEWALRVGVIPWQQVIGKTKDQG